MLLLLLLSSSSSLVVVVFAFLINENKALFALSRRTQRFFGYFKLVIVVRFYEQIYLSNFSYCSNLFLVLCAVPQARELYTRAAQSSRVGCSRRVHRIVYLAVKKGNILVNILLLKIYFANDCHL